MNIAFLLLFSEDLLVNPLDNYYFEKTVQKAYTDAVSHFYPLPATITLFTLFSRKICQGYLEEYMEEEKSSWDSYGHLY